MTTGKGWAGLKLPAGSTSIRSPCGTLNTYIPMVKSPLLMVKSWWTSSRWIRWWISHFLMVQKHDIFHGKSQVFDDFVRILMVKKFWGSCVVRILWGTNKCLMVNCTICLFLKIPHLTASRTFSQVCRAVIQAGKNGCRSGTVMILAFLNGPFKAGEWWCVWHVQLWWW